MNEKIDIFAVMDRYGFTCGDPDSDCSKVRAAVAELVEADKAYDAARRAWDNGLYSEWDGISADPARLKVAVDFEGALARRAAALARIGGTP